MHCLDLATGGRQLVRAWQRLDREATEAHPVQQHSERLEQNLPVAIVLLREMAPSPAAASQRRPVVRERARSRCWSAVAPLLGAQRVPDPPRRAPRQRLEVPHGVCHVGGREQGRCVRGIAPAALLRQPAQRRRSGGRGLLRLMARAHHALQSTDDGRGASRAEDCGAGSAFSATSRLHCVADRRGFARARAAQKEARGSRPRKLRRGAWCCGLPSARRPERGAPTRGPDPA